MDGDRRHRAGRVVDGVLTIVIVADAQDNEPTPPGVTPPAAAKQDVATLKVGDCSAHPGRPGGGRTGHRLRPATPRGGVRGADPARLEVPG